ncbi:MAG TPA: helix-turn-helix domain-containing protein, partial [Chloroflexota bacterium]|nr:helix-turn-helix domain-containing protein [Chloroflexota bacterium]
MEETREQQPQPTIEISDLDALKIMSDPLRLRIVDLLRQAPATVKQLAAAMETAPRSLYYHINLLERHGLIRVVATRLVSGIQEKTYRATAYLFLYKDLAPAGAPAQPEQLREVVVSSFFNITAEEIRDSIRAGRIDLDGDATPERALTAEWRLLRLSPAQAASLTARLEALLDEYPSYEGAIDQDDGQTYRCLLTLFPTYHRGERAARAAALDE